MKVSLDFDSTLSEPEIFEFAKQLKTSGYDIWIVTARLSDELAPEKFWNSDLWEVVEKLNIDKSNVIFRSYQPKCDFFKTNSDFLFHLDDDMYELNEINLYTSVPGIFYHKNVSWRDKVMKILKK